MTDQTPSNARQRIRGYITGTLLGGRDIEDDENLLLSGLIDSLGVMSLVAFLERTFGISIPFDEVILENFMSIDAVDDYVGKKLP